MSQPLTSRLRLCRAHVVAVAGALALALVASLPAIPGAGAAAGDQPSGEATGYWLVASDGGIFSFGDAPFHGSTGDIVLNEPIVGMAPTASGAGYWLVASDGGIFSFGDAAFHGSGAPTGKTFTGMVPTATGRGYWLAATDGTVLPFGDAAALGSATVAVPVVGMAGTPTGNGYWLVGGDGGIFSFGDAHFHGSTGHIRLNQPIVGVGVRPGPLPERTAPTTSTGPPPTSGGGTSSTTTTTAPPDDPQGNGRTPEPINPPMESPNGGTSTADLPRNGTECGLPAAPERTIYPDDIDDVGEASGMVASSNHPGVYWMIRDSSTSQDRRAVYAITFGSDGIPVSRPIPIPGAFNGDWEEINYTTGPDGRGRLWITESGQNTSLGTFDEIYEVLEPDPFEDESAELLNTYEYEYPDRSYNTEAAFIHDGFLVMVTKQSPHAPVYRFDTLVPIDELAPGADPLDHSPRPKNVPTYLGEFGNSKDVSVVRQSPDGKLLVTASHQAVHLYRSTDGSGSLRSFLGRLPDCELLAFPDDHVEAGEFSSHDEMVFMDEVKRGFRLPLEP